MHRRDGPERAIAPPARPCFKQTAQPLRLRQLSGPLRVLEQPDDRRPGPSHPPPAATSECWGASPQPPRSTSAPLSSPHSDTGRDTSAAAAPLLRGQRLVLRHLHSESHRRDALGVPQRPVSVNDQARPLGQVQRAPNALRNGPRNCRRAWSPRNVLRKLHGGEPQPVQFYPVPLGRHSIRRWFVSHEPLTGREVRAPPAAGVTADESPRRRASRSFGDRAALRVEGGRRWGVRGARAARLGGRGLPIDEGSGAARGSSGCGRGGWAPPTGLVRSDVV